MLDRVAAIKGSAAPKSKKEKSARHLNFRRTALIWPVAFFLCRPFAPGFLTAAVLAFVLTILLGSTLGRMLTGRRNHTKREHYLYLLQFLCGELAAGSNLHRALLRADRLLPEQIGEKSQIYRAVHAGAGRLRLQEDTAAALRTIGQQANLSEALDLFYLLAGSNNLGSRQLYLLQDAAAAQQKVTAVQREVRSEQFATIAEALALLTMPFAVGSVFSGMYEQLQVSRRQPIVIICSLLAFLLSLLAIATATHILWPTTKQPAAKEKELKPSDFGRRFFRFCCRSGPVNTLAKKLLGHLPATYKIYLKQQHQLLLNKVSAAAAELEKVLIDDFAQRLVSLCWCLSGLAIPLALGRLPPFCLISLPALWFYFEQRLRRQAVALRRELQKDLPFFLESLLQYLTSGFVPLQAFKAAAKSGQDAHKPLYSLLLRLADDIQFHGHFSARLQQFAWRLNNMNSQTVFLLLAQYAENGHQESLAALKNQKYVCWDLYRKEIMAEQKLTAGKLLLPMALDLLAVMLIALAPALSVFSSF